MLGSANLGPSVFLVFYYRLTLSNVARLLQNLAHIVSQTTWTIAANLVTVWFFYFLRGSHSNDRIKIQDFFRTFQHHKNKKTHRRTQLNYKHLSYYSEKQEIWANAHETRESSSSCSQTVSLSPAVFAIDWPTTVKWRLLRGYRSLMPSCAGFLEPRKSRLRPSKSTFNAKNFTCSLCMFVSIGFSATRS